MKHFSASPISGPVPAAHSANAGQPSLPNKSRRTAMRRLALGLVLLLAAAAPAWAQTTVTTNFGYTGGTQTYLVPAGVTSLAVVANGAASGYGGAGNISPVAGAQVSATLPVTPGEVLTVVVGGMSVGNSGGYNGGGYSAYTGGSGGGGATDLRRSAAAGSTNDQLTSRNALLVAGGGGGSQFSTVRGGEGGLPTGSNGQANVCPAGGTGGTQTGGGTGLNNGFLGQGGSGGTSNGVGCPGGGGGYYGGGSGRVGRCAFGSTYYATGAGGGSSWVASTGSGFSYAAAPAGYGSLAITATLPAPTISLIAPTSGSAGSAVTITGTYFTGATAVKFNGAPAGSFTVNSDNSITATVPYSASSGTISVTAPGGTATSSQSFTFQALRVTARNPARNSRSAAVTTTVGLTFDQAPTLASAAGIRLFSSQYKGRRTATVGVSGNTATLTPTGGSFRPGERVAVSVPATVQSSGGTPALPHNYQFIAAAGGSGRGVFPSRPDISLTGAFHVAPGDVDGDGDLDLAVTTNSAVAVLLNDGSANFTSGPSTTTGGQPTDLALGDVDGDGDLDVVVAYNNTFTVATYLNGGGGTFSSYSSTTVTTRVRTVLLGDVDADGDLDLLSSGDGDAATVRLNDGTGNFSGGSTIAVPTGSVAYTVGAADVNNDGFLDILTANFNSGTVSVRLNNGSGAFTLGSYEVGVGGLPLGLVLGDVNNDGYVDILTSGASNGLVSVRLNNGAGGGFGGSQEVSAGANLRDITLGDVDADGDLDLAVSNGYTGSTVALRLNDGAGNFSGGSDVAVGPGPYTPVLADLDGDGDLDLATADYGPTSQGNSVSVRLNLPPVPTITSFTPSSGVPGASVTITGTNFTGTTAVTFNGTAAPGFVVNSATQITVSVPVAATTGLVAVTTPGGTATSAASFTVVRPPVISSFTPSSGPVGTSVTITGTDLAATTAVRLNGTAGTITGTPTATSLTFTVTAGSTSGAVALATPVGVAASAANPVLRLQATGGTSSDNTAYLDQVEILNAVSGAVVAGGVSNGSFETGAPAGTLTSPGTAVTPWTFGGSARLSTTASAFGPPAPPDASAHVVVLQLGGCYVEQPLTLGAGTYQVRFQLAQRQCCATPYDQGINVLLNGVAVGTSLTTSSAGYVSLVSAPFTVSAAGVFTVIPAPTLTAVAPNPGGLGQSITLTGTGLGSPTALTINGANALANIINNTGTTLVVRVPATATASGNVSLTTAGGTATSATFTIMAPPGNALAFDEADDYVAFGSTPAVSNLGPGSFTLEAWVYYDGGTGAESIIRKDGDYNLYLNGKTLHAEVWTGGTGSPTWQRIDGTATTLPANRWAHVAAVWNGSTMQLFVNGVAEASTTTTGSISVSANLTLGKSQAYGNLLNGRLDEVRIYTAALTQANIQVDMLSTAAAVPASLKFYLNFDQGTPATASTGNNAGLTTLYDLANGYAGTLTSFALASGNTTSNYVESYALVVPTATAATAISNNAFTANWTAPAVGTVTSYKIDVARDLAFASPVSGSPFTQATGTALAFTGLPGGTLYYRVRADKTSVTGQGASSNVITVVVPSATLSCSAAANNALKFDGSSDYVHTTGTLPNTGEFTLETWVNPATLPVGFSGLLLSDDFPAGAMHWQFNGSTLQFTVNGSNPADQLASFTVPTGTWSHVAVVYSANAKTAKFYLNGVLQVTRAYTSAIAVAALPYGVGGWLSGGPQRFLNGSLNELRVWGVARTDAQILASYNQALPAQTGLAILYSFDQGAAGGTNTGLTTLNDDADTGHSGTLNTFALTGSASNWVVGNALAYTLGLTSFSPGSAAPGVSVALSGSGFTGVTAVRFNGTAASFTVVNGSTITAAVPAGAATGPVTVTGPCGTVTSSGSFTVCALPVAIAQNASVTLDVNGNATVAATAVNNGSTANCGPAAASALSVSPGSFSCTDAVPATVANALSLNNAANQYVAIPATAAVPVGNSSYTIEAWIKPTVMGDYGIIGWGNYGTYNQVNALRLYPGGVHNYWWANDLSAPTTSLAGAWHHVAATYDQATNTRRLYLDGVFQVQDTPPAGHNVPTAGNLRIGSTNNGEYFPGSIDEVRVWNVARTAAQLNAAKGAGLPGGTAGLVAYYRLNEGSGTLANDATGSAANQGTLTNGPTWTTAAAPVTNGVPATLTVTDAGGNTATAPAVVTVSVPATPATTWDGSASTAWTACANWSFGKMPDAATSAVIPTGQPRYPTLATGNTYPVLDLTVNLGGTLTLNTGATLQVNGNLANNGTAALSGPVQFVGSAATQTLSNGSGFNTVVVNKASGTVQLAQNLTINSALTLSSGTLSTTGSYQVDLGGSATLSESETSYVIGKVVVNRTPAPGTAEAFSGLGLTLTPAAGSVAPGATLVTRTTGAALAGVGTSQSVLRYFDIQPAVKTGLNVTMSFAYFDHELNGIAPANLALFKSVTTTAGPWIPQHPVTLSANVVTKTGIADFSIWTLGNSANPLPVELTVFTAAPQGRAVQLKWRTASEKNSDRFEVERSLTGTTFERIGTVAGQGTTASATDYALLDSQLPAGITGLYYRLRQVDRDGTAAYSPVRLVLLAASATPQLLAYPNPAHDAVRVLLLGPATTAPLEVYDALGRLVRSQPAPASGTETGLPLAGLPAGVYVLRCGPLARRLTLE